jgi:hypothetical protein
MICCQSKGLHDKQYEGGISTLKGFIDLFFLHNSTISMGCIVVVLSKQCYQLTLMS